MWEHGVGEGGNTLHLLLELLVGDVGHGAQVIHNVLRGQGGVSTVSCGEQRGALGEHHAKGDWSTLLRGGGGPRARKGGACEGVGALCGRKGRGMREPLDRGWSNVGMDMKECFKWHTEWKHSASSGWEYLVWSI